MKNEKRTEAELIEELDASTGNSRVRRRTTPKLAFRAGLGYFVLRIGSFLNEEESEMKRLIIFAVAGAVLLAPGFALAEEIEDTSQPPRGEPSPAEEGAEPATLAVSEQAESGEGTLNITTDPKRAEISLDGVYIGVAPISELAVEVGEHVVKAEHAGCHILEARVTVEIGEVKELHMELVERLEKSESWWGRNRVYFTIGAIVIVAGVLVVYFVGAAAAP